MTYASTAEQRVADSKPIQCHQAISRCEFPTGATELAIEGRTTFFFIIMITVVVLKHRVDNEVTHLAVYEIDQIEDDNHDTHTN